MYRQSLISGLNKKDVKFIKPYEELYNSIKEREKAKKKTTTPLRFELRRPKGTALAGQRVNHSTTVSHWSNFKKLNISSF